MVLINGQPAMRVDVADRGFQYGDGLFETLAIRNQTPLFLAEHLQRLIAGCQKLAIPLPDLDVLVDEARRLALTVSAAAVLKIIVTRGGGGRGYNQPEIIKPTRVLSLHPFPVYPDDYAKIGINTRFCHTRLGLNPALAGIKHLNRLEQVIARAEWRDTTIQEGIMLGLDGYVREGTMANIFYAKNQHLYTPDLSQAGIAGIIRALLLSSRHGIEVSVLPVSPADLCHAEEVFVCNSIIGIWPVVQLADRRFSIGPVTRHMQTWLEKLSDETVPAGC